VVPRSWSSVSATRNLGNCTGGGKCSWSATAAVAGWQTGDAVTVQCCGGVANNMTCNGSGNCTFSTNTKQAQATDQVTFTFIANPSTYSLIAPRTVGFPAL